MSPSDSSNQRVEYQVEFETSAAREFRKLPDAVKKRLAPAIDALSAEPRPAGCLKMAGRENFYRIRVGDYRIVYEIEDEILIVVIIKVAHRREVYRSQN